MSQDAPNERKRVASKIADSILMFAAYVGSQPFNVEQLHNYVRDRHKVAPASTDRILRMMRQEGQLDYRVLNRRDSRYRFIPKDRLF